MKQDNDATYTEERGKFERLLRRTAIGCLRLVAAAKKRNRLPVNLHKIRKVLVIRQHNQFGDVLCTVPLLRALKKKLSLDVLDVVVSPQNKYALDGCPYISKLIVYDKLAFYRNPVTFFKFISSIRQNYDVVLVPSNVSLSLTNDIIALFSKGRWKIGPASLETKENSTAFVYDIAVDLRWHPHLKQSYRNMLVARPLGIEPEDDTGELEYYPDRQSEEIVQALITRTGSVQTRIGLHVGAGKPPNRWNVNNFINLAKKLQADLGALIYLTEGSFDHEVVNEFVLNAEFPFVRIRNHSIKRVSAFLKAMNLVVTNDTGIMHLAAAVGTPTLSLFGPTDPLQWAPIGKKHKFILGSRQDVNSISVERVYSTLLNMIRPVEAP
ncbi:MAG: glycosyltransferase family 9 protein [Candidatus Kryptoniota bacterium]